MILNADFFLLLHVKVLITNALSLEEDDSAVNSQFIIILRYDFFKPLS